MSARKTPSAATETFYDISDEELRAKVDALVARRSALTAEEVALFRYVYESFYIAHFDLVMAVLSKWGAPAGNLEDLRNESYLSFYLAACNEGFPENIPAKLHSIARGLARNDRRNAKSKPEDLGTPSSRSEVPRSAPDIERVMDLKELARRLLPALSPLARTLVQDIILDGKSHDAVAAERGVSRSTVTTQLQSAKRRLATLAELFLPKSQR